MPTLHESVSKRDTIKTLALALGSAIFLSFDQSKNATTVALVNTLVVELTKVAPGILQDVTMTTAALTLLRGTVSASELDSKTRVLILGKLKELIAFSEVWIKLVFSP